MREYRQLPGSWPRAACMPPGSPIENCANPRSEAIFFHVLGDVDVREHAGNRTSGRSGRLRRWVKLLFEDVHHLAGHTPPFRLGGALQYVEQRPVDPHGHHGCIRHVFESITHRSAGHGARRRGRVSG